MNLIFKPMIMRALFGEKLEALRAENRANHSTLTCWNVAY